MSASWTVSELVCRRVSLSASWSVGELVVGELVCRRVVQLPMVPARRLCNNPYDVTHFSYFDSAFLAGMLKIQIVATGIDINSHNYQKNNTRNLRLWLVHGWHYMVRDLALVFILGFGFIF